MAFRDESMVPQPESMLWTDIYISQRPQYFARFPDHLHELVSRLSLPPNAPFRIGIPMLSAFSHNHESIIWHTSQVAPGWDGSTPLSISFNGSIYSSFIITLGRCTCAKTTGFQEDKNDSMETVLGPHFVTVQDGLRLTPKDLSHNCEEDHVKVGTILQWPLMYATRLQVLLPCISDQYLQISLSK